MSRIFGQYFSAAFFDKDGEFQKTIDEINAAVESCSDDSGDGIENN